MAVDGAAEVQTMQQSAGGAEAVRRVLGVLGALTFTGGLARAGYRGLVSGALAPDLGFGRRTRSLGPQQIDIDAPRQTVFDVIATPYLGRATRAQQAKIEVLERGEDLVLAAHRTQLPSGRFAVTVETVRFSPPERVDFRLVRGPVPYVVETFELTELADGDGTSLSYRGELGTDLWWVGERWAAAVAQRWEVAVAETFAAVAAEAERRAR